MKLYPRSRFCILGMQRMLFSSFPHKSQSWRLRVVKEEDRFVKELGLIEDMFVPSRRSSLNRVRLSTTLFQTSVLINRSL